MKKHVFAMVILAVLVSSPAWACGDDSDGHAENTSSMAKPSFSLAAAQPAGAANQRAIFHVQGMVCTSCKKKIEASLRRIEGVQAVRFDLKKKLAEVTFANGKSVPAETLIKAVQEAGFDATQAKLN